MLITYNHEKYIAQALDSVLMQKTDFSIEICVIEDCSTDRTAEIILSYAERYPHIVKPYLNKINIGRKVTQRNFFRGFKTLTGKYFCILEGDDYWISPLKLQIQVDFLESHPEYALCAHNTIKIYEDNSQEPHRFLYFGKQEDGTVDDAISLRMFFHTTGIVYRNVFEGKPPRQYQNKWSCDIFVTISHAAYGKIHHIDEDLAVYRAHGGGRFSTMSQVDGWKYNIGGLQRYNAWLGFRFAKPFSKTLVKYCNVILNETGRNGVPGLSLTDRLKYTFIKGVYLIAYGALDVPDRVNRKLMLASLRLKRGLEGRRLQVERTMVGAGHKVALAGARVAERRRVAEQVSINSDFEAYPGLPISSGLTASLLKILRRILAVEMSEVCLPSIELFGPQPVEAGQAFNLQPDGRSAIWLQLEAPAPIHTLVIFGGTALSTVAAGRVVTAAVPTRLTAKPGQLPVWIEAADVNGIRISDPVYFDVISPVLPVEYARIPSIEDFGPQLVYSAKPFNVQADGQSAIWIQLSTPAPRHTNIVVDGTKLPTIVDGCLLTAVVPAHVTSQPREMPVWLESGGNDTVQSSERVYLRVMSPSLTQEFRMPSIVVFGPQPVEPGIRFNVQGDGQSAVWVKATAAVPARTWILFGETKLQSFVNHDMVTALVPSKLIMDAGEFSIRLQAEIDGQFYQSDLEYFYIGDVSQLRPKILVTAATELVEHQLTDHERLDQIQQEEHIAGFAR